MSVLTRRQLLQRSGQLAASAGIASQLEWLGGCGSDQSPTGPDWAQLDARLRGNLVLPADPSYARISRPQNRAYADIHPAGMALCADGGDARESLLWALDNELPVAIRSGGHNYAGYAVGPGLVIDLGRMKRVEVDDARGTLTVQPGATNVDVYKGLQPHGVAISAGRCPTVAIGGLVLGGGIGFSSRKLGLTCDALLEAEMVSASGEALRCSEGENPDLFWALRGGGGGNFGVCTSYVFRTQPVSDVTLYDIEWDWQDAAAVITAFQGVIDTAGDEFSARIGVGSPGLPSGRAGPPAISALGQFFGPKRELVQLLDPALTAAKPKQSLIAPRSFWQAKNYFFDTTPKGYWATKSTYLDQPLAGQGIDALLGSIESWPGSSNAQGAGAAMFASGGAINRVSPHATAFIHRDQFALVAMEATWSGGDPQRVVDANVAWLERFAESLVPHTSSFAYQNFIDRSQADWQHAYYGSNLARLTEVKRTHDPDNVFSFEQSIPLRA